MSTRGRPPGRVGAAEVIAEILRPKRLARVDYAQCIFCGKTVPERKIRPGTYENYDVTRFTAWQIREGGGKLPSTPQVTDLSGELFARPKRKGRGRAPGRGFKIVEGKTIFEMFRDPRLAPYAERIKKRLLLIVGQWLETGVIRTGEIRPLIPRKQPKLEKALKRKPPGAAKPTKPRKVKPKVEETGELSDEQIQQIVARAYAYDFKRG